MLRDLDLSKYTHVYIAPRYTDLRAGIPGLSAIVQHQFNLDVFDESSIFLFCGKRRDRMKALCYDSCGFTLLYFRLNPGSGRFQWPMNAEDVMSMTPEQYKRLIHGFSIDPSIYVSRINRKKETVK